MLVDTGGEDNDVFHSDVRLAAYLSEFLVDRPDLHGELALLVLTHPHLDYTRGVSMVLASYVPFDKLGADLLFTFISRMYERRSLIVTTNLPFARWGEVCYDATAAAAVIDRIVHHATSLKTEGESFRLRDRKREARSRKASA